MLWELSLKISSLAYRVTESSWQCDGGERDFRYSPVFESRPRIRTAFLGMFAKNPSWAETETSAFYVYKKPAWVGKVSVMQHGLSGELWVLSCTSIRLLLFLSMADGIHNSHLRPGPGAYWILRFPWKSWVPLKYHGVHSPGNHAWPHQVGTRYTPHSPAISAIMYLPKVPCILFH